MKKIFEDFFQDAKGIVREASSEARRAAKNRALKSSPATAQAKATKIRQEMRTLIRNFLTAEGLPVPENLNKLQFRGLNRILEENGAPEELVERLESLNSQISRQSSGKNREKSGESRFRWQYIIVAGIIFLMLGGMKLLPVLVSRASVVIFALVGIVYLLVRWREIGAPSAIVSELTIVAGGFTGWHLVDLADGNPTNIFLSAGPHNLGLLLAGVLVTFFVSLLALWLAKKKVWWVWQALFLLAVITFFVMTLGGTQALLDAVVRPYLRPMKTQ